MPENKDDGCKFDRVWIGPCGKTPAVGGRCEDHAKTACCSCGKPATRECDHTGIQFVCGYPLCDGCAHNAPQAGKEGMFNLGGGHCDKATAEANWEKRFAAMDAEQARLAEPQYGEPKK
jgi:hypothetical protein